MTSSPSVGGAPEPPVVEALGTAVPAGLIGRAKAAARRSVRVYEAIRRRRARRQDERYVELRDRAVHDGGAIFAPPGYAHRAARMLQESRRSSPVAKARLADVRMFAAFGDLSGGPRFRAAFERSVDAAIFDWGAYRTSYDPADERPGWAQEMRGDLLDAVRAAHDERPLDLVFAYGSHLEYDRETLNAIRAMGVPVALVWLDDKHTFSEDRTLGYPNGQEPLVGAADVHLTNSRECLRLYLARGAAAYWMPQAIDTEFFRPLDVPLDIDVSFLGQRYGYRAQLVERLRRSGIDVACFGPGWGTSVISENEKIELYNRSRINLGTGVVGYSDAITCIKGRDTEVTACGGFYLTTFDAELAEMFHVGREIACYRNEIDCVEMIRYYLEAEDERRAVAAAGRERCLRDHAWEVRLDALFRWMGLLRAPGPVARGAAL
jgi:hypothetical protein